MRAERELRMRIVTMIVLGAMAATLATASALCAEQSIDLQPRTEAGAEGVQTIGPMVVGVDVKNVWLGGVGGEPWRGPKREEDMGEFHGKLFLGFGRAFEDLLRLEEFAAELLVFDFLDGNVFIDGHGGGDCCGLAEHHEDGFHAD